MKWDAKGGRWSLEGNFPAIQWDPPNNAYSAVNQEDIARVPAEPELPPAPYFVTVARRTGHRRLHLSKSCAVREERCIETRPVFQLTPDVAESNCKHCKPKIDKRSAASEPETTSEQADADA